MPYAIIFDHSDVYAKHGWKFSVTNYLVNIAYALLGVTLVSSALKTKILKFWCETIVKHDCAVSSKGQSE